MVAAGAREDRGAHVLGRPARERRPAGADRRRRVGVAVADLGEAVLGREPHDRAVAVPAEGRGVERLDRVGADGGIVIGQEAAEHEALGAQRVRDERVGGDREAALVVDRLDRPAQAPERGYRPLEEQPEQVAAARRDLLAHDDLERAGRGPRPCARAASAASIRSWSAIAMTSRKPCASTWSRISVDRRRAVRRERVDVEVGAAEADERLRVTRRPLPRRRAFAARRPRAVAARSTTQVRPDRVEGAPPLLRARRRGSTRTPAAIAAVRAIIRSRRGARLRRRAPAISLPRVAPVLRAARRARVDRHAGLEREQRGSGGDRRRVAEERDHDPGARAGRGPRPARPTRRGGARACSGAPGVGDRDDVDADPAPRLDEPALQPGVRDGLHRRGDAVADEVRDLRPRAARWRRSACPTRTTGRPRSQRLADLVRRLHVDPGERRSRGRSRRSARPRGSSGRHAGSAARTMRSSASGSVAARRASRDAAARARPAPRRRGRGSRVPGRPAPGAIRYHSSPMRLGGGDERRLGQPARATRSPARIREPRRPDAAGGAAGVASRPAVPGTARGLRRGRCRDRGRARPSSIVAARASSSRASAGRAATSA